MSELTNIILISIDDLRFDCLSIEKDKRWLERYNAHNLVDTPTLDEISKKGVRFTQCISTSSYTPGSHASMLTGLYIKNHRVRTFFDPLPTKIATISEILKAHGWNTNGWTEHLTLKMQQVTKGIDNIIEPFKNESNLFEFIENVLAKEKNFLFIHCFDVHKPYLYTTGGTERDKYNKNFIDEIEKILDKLDVNSKSLFIEAEQEAKRVVKNYKKLNSSLKEYAIYRSLDYLLREKLNEHEVLFEELIPLYVKGVNKFDQGRLKDIIKKITETGLMENGLLILTADHGETRCKWNGHDDFMNSFNTSEGAIRVPLIFYSDLLANRLELNEQVSLIDIVPTILDLLGIIINKKIDGLSLKPLIENGESMQEFDRYLFSEAWAYQGTTTFFGNADNHIEGDFLAEASARKNGLKYIWRNNKVGAHGFYNVNKDPFEENNLESDKRAKKYAIKLQKYLMDYHFQKVSKDIIGKMILKKDSAQS